MTPTPVVVDSSVALEWLMHGDAERVAESQAVLEDHAAGRIAITAPTHLLLEITNALWAHRAKAGQIKRATELLWNLRVEFVEPDAVLLARAADMAVEHGLTVYDAVFVALAEQLDCELVTGDRKLAESGVCRVRPLR